MSSTATNEPVKVFVSYRYLDGEWVWNWLVPCPRAGGAEALIDEDRFRPGGGVYRQMDAAQDNADRHVLVVPGNYLASESCRHEMEPAVALDPKFGRHIVQPVRRDNRATPDLLKSTDSMFYTAPRDDRAAAPWKKLLDECGADLGTTAPHWLDARDEVARWLRDDTSGNLLVLDDGEWDYVSAFRGVDTQPPPTDDAIFRSIRRRLLVVEEAVHWRLRVPPDAALAAAALTTPRLPANRPPPYPPGY